ncbi:MAG: hypothetical protein AAB767_03380, partial [Patescibacteria group bacterium]
MTDEYEIWYGISDRKWAQKSLTSTVLWQQSTKKGTAMKGALLLQSNDVELVNRGYNVALKLIPNVVGQMTLTQLEYLEANPPELANAATRALQINLQPATESRNVIEQPKVIVPNLRQTGSTLADWLKGREELHKFFTGETIVLTDLFALTPEE